MPARKPGGKYKGKIGRAKGEATIAAELEARRRKAYEENLKRLQERRAADLLAEQGLQSEEDQAKELLMAKIAQMFPQGKKADLKKGFKNWRIGHINSKREKALIERQTCWRRSCEYCTEDGKAAKYPEGHKHTCKSWWKSSLGRENWGEELNPRGAAADRPQACNQNRLCSCCGADTGISGQGCRAWQELTDPTFETPAARERRMARVQFAEESFGLMSGRSASTPTLGFESPRDLTRYSPLSGSVMNNWQNIRRQQARAQVDVPEYDPTSIFLLSPEQEAAEERKRWIETLSKTAGSAESRRLGRLGSMSGTLPSLTDTLAPKITAKGKPLEQVAHWRTGQKTMLDRHMMKMYVVGSME